MLEDELYQANSAMKQYSQAQQLLQDKIKDLENQSRRNNLRIINLPEAFKAESVLDLCATCLPEALGLPDKCVAERTHRFSAPSNNRKSSRPVIVKYLMLAILPCF